MRKGKNKRRRHADTCPVVAVFSRGEWNGRRGLIRLHVLPHEFRREKSELAPDGLTCGSSGHECHAPRSSPGMPGSNSGRSALHSVERKAAQTQAVALKLNLHAECAPISSVSVGKCDPCSREARADEFPYIRSAESEATYRLIKLNKKSDCGVGIVLQAAGHAAGNGGENGLCCAFEHGDTGCCNRDCIRAGAPGASPF